MNMLIYTSQNANVEAEKEIKKLKRLASETSKIIYELHSIFPFQLFPDKIVIDENKVTIVRNDLLFKRIIPIEYSDILMIKINKSIAFSSMEFEVKRSKSNSIVVTYLNPKKATFAKEYIMGILIAKKANVDFSRLSLSEIREQLRKIGYGKEDKEGLLP